VCAQGVPGDQHGIGVKVTVTGPGYRLRVVDGSPHSTGHTYLITPQAAVGFRTTADGRQGSGLRGGGGRVS